VNGAEMEASVTNANSCNETLSIKIEEALKAEVNNCKKEPRNKSHENEIDDTNEDVVVMDDQLKTTREKDNIHFSCSFCKKSIAQTPQLQKLPESSRQTFQKFAMQKMLCLFKKTSRSPAKYRKETFQMFVLSKIFCSITSIRNSSPNTYNKEETFQVFGMSKCGNVQIFCSRR
jgi:hypothetical protein